MKRRPCIGLLTGAAVLAALLLSHAPSARAQPVATIELPAPGAAKQLFPGCNNITLSFPGGTPSQEVVQAVAPPGAVESLWRHSAALNKFEGFSPAYPQASDLLTVNFLDAVWVCMVEDSSAIAPPACSGPPVVAAFAANPGIITTGQTSTLSWGPVQNTNHVTIDQGIGEVAGWDSMVVAPIATTMYTLTATGCGGTTTRQVTITVNAGGPPAADLAVVDLYVDNPPQGQVWATIANNGPSSLANASVDLTCDAVQTPKFCAVPGPCLPLALLSLNQIVVSLDPGQTADFDTGIAVDTFSFDYDVTCGVSTAAPDPNVTNNSYSEPIMSVAPGAVVSDRNLKERFAFVDGQEVLSRLSDVPITTWSYKAEDPAIRHMGPTAQDFRAAFGLGESSTSISMLDSSGVALAAIQGLYERSQEQAVRIQELEGQNVALQRQLDDLGTQGKSASTGLLSSDLPVAWLLLGGLVAVALALAGRRLVRARR